VAVLSLSSATNAAACELALSVPLRGKSALTRVPTAEQLENTHGETGGVGTGHVVNKNAL
jgi:hypothetical protein